MTDKEYELSLKDVDCCQNCVHFSLGMHYDGCPKGWCNRGEWKIVKREDVCNKYKRRCRMSRLTRENSELEARNADNNYFQFIKDIEQEPISEMREIKEGWLWLT